MAALVKITAAAMRIVHQLAKFLQCSSRAAVADVTKLPNAIGFYRFNNEENKYMNYYFKNFKELLEIFTKFI